MRWLLRKDLLILRRSRLLLALLVVYPIAIALLIGFAISRSPAKPRVAIVDETPARGDHPGGQPARRASANTPTVFSQVDASRRLPRAGDRRSSPGRSWRPS